MTKHDYFQYQMSINKSIVNCIRTARETKGLTIEEVAERVGIDKETLKNIESFRQFPYFDLLKKLYDVLEIEIRKIVDSEYNCSWMDLLSESDMADYLLDETEKSGAIIDRIGFRIFELRKDRFTQQELALKAGIAQSALSKLESCTTNKPSRRTLEKIAHVLKISFSELIKETEYEKLEAYEDEDEAEILGGSVSFCANTKCPNATYYIIERGGKEWLKFMRYTRFPRNDDSERPVRFCKFCGGKLTIACKCGAEIGSDSRFCPHCGEKIYPEEPEDNEPGYPFNVHERGTLTLLSKKRRLQILETSPEPEKKQENEPTPQQDHSRFSNIG